MPLGPLGHGRKNRFTLEPRKFVLDMEMGLNAGNATSLRKVDNVKCYRLPVSSCVRSVHSAVCDALT